ncbi:MAG: DUF4388 domain-containing protein [Caldisericales bacterium]|nr:DUF4388 domain-containing protein [Caldisericales bacterium]
MLSGEINGAGLLELLRFLISQNQAGTVTVSCISGSGFIRIRMGEIIFARWQDKLAEQAFYEIIKLDSLKFAFEQGDSLETNITKLTESLLKTASIYTEMQDRFGQGTILSRNSLGEGSQITIDSDKLLIAVIIGSGTTYSNLVSSLPFPEGETRRLVMEMLEEGTIAARKAEIKKDIFLIPKATRVKLDAGESEVLLKITKGMKLATLFEGMAMSLDGFADTLCMLCLKGAVSIMDEYSKPLDLMKLYDVLGLHGITCQKELSVGINNSATAKRGQVLVDEYLYEMWTMRARGRKVETIELRNVYYKPVFDVTRMKNLDGKVMFAPIDATRFDLKEGKRVVCFPNAKGD